jgi:hypothetical protein
VYLNYKEADGHCAVCLYFLSYKTRAKYQQQEQFFNKPWQMQAK